MGLNDWLAIGSSSCLYSSKYTNRFVLTTIKTAQIVLWKDHKSFCGF